MPTSLSTIWAKLRPRMDWRAWLAASLILGLIASVWSAWADGYDLGPILGVVFFYAVFGVVVCGAAWFFQKTKPGLFLGNLAKQIVRGTTSLAVVALFGFVLFWLISSSAGFLLGSHYAAEVGYHQGDSQRFDVWGDFGTLDECRSAAIARFNYYNRENPRRAFSWACLKKNRSGGFESRHR